MEARLSIQVVPYVTDRGQRKHELRCVWKMHICIIRPQFVKSGYNFRSNHSVTEIVAKVF
jgi:hypothetical protein